MNAIHLTIDKADDIDIDAFGQMAYNEAVVMIRDARKEKKTAGPMDFVISGVTFHIRKSIVVGEYSAISLVSALNATDKLVDYEVSIDTAEGFVNISLTWTAHTNASRKDYPRKEYKTLEGKGSSRAWL